MFRRRLLLAAAAFVLAGCDPIQTRGLLVSPGPAPEASAQEQALGLIEAAAARHGLRPVPETPFAGEEGWRCHRLELFRVCATAVAAAVQIYFYERGTSFSARARSVWGEIETALRAEFGSDAVRECRFARRPDPKRGENEPAVLRQLCVPRSPARAAPGSGAGVATS